MGSGCDGDRGWPSADRDLLALLWWCRGLLPVGFYYKALARPRWAWPVAERYIRRLVGLGPVAVSGPITRRERQHHHVDVLVAGGGIAGLSAALAAADLGESVVLVDEGLVGEKVAPGPTRSTIERLSVEARASSRVTMLERTRVAGVYEGPLVIAAGDTLVHWVHPRRIVIATGGVERHAVFRGNDVPGVWLARGAARLAGVHGVAPGRSAVVVADTAEAAEHVATLRRVGVTIRALLVPASLAALMPADLEMVVDGSVIGAKGGGGKRLRSVVINGPGGRGRRTILCDALIVAAPLVPRDGLLRQAIDVAGSALVAGAGDVAEPGCTIERAMASGARAGRRVPTPSRPSAGLATAAPRDGIMCLCEDVGVDELVMAWREGFRWTELLKRYTTATMGPCQGQLCHEHLRAFAIAHTSPGPPMAPTPMVAATTARPPARPITIEEAAAGVDQVVEQRTALHDRHVGRGARMEWAGAWKRPAAYGDVATEYWAVRRGVGIMDVGTLGKYRICGPDAAEFLDRLYPVDIRNIRVGKTRYGMLLNEAGYIFDDGLIAALEPHDYFVTVTSGGADAAEAWMRDWAETWRMRVHIINLTAVLGAINVAGPRARDLLTPLTRESIDGPAFPYSGNRRLSVAGIPCIALRAGFTGELSFELHHARSRSVELWDTLLSAGAALDVMPHGLDALKLLRLEKRHIIINQDTDFDTTPAKAGLDGLVKRAKPYFVGRAALRRLAACPADRRLLPLRFVGDQAPDEGAQLLADDQYVGYLTSSRYSPVLEHSVALGWVATDRTGETEITALSRGGRRTTGAIVAGSGAFYDPMGERLRV